MFLPYGEPQMMPMFNVFFTALVVLEGHPVTQPLVAAYDPETATIDDNFQTLVTLAVPATSLTPRSSSPTSLDAPERLL